MAKFQLTISTNYVEDWGLYEGLREIIQNALDGDQDGCPMSVDYSETAAAVTISNKGARLDRSVWLLGNSSKTADTHRGHFGEGLKLGALALVRAGHPVSFVNGDETWCPSITESDAFPGQQVLSVATRKRPSSTGSFSVVVGNVPAGEWTRITRAFLALHPDAPEHLHIRDHHSAGKVHHLTGDMFKGKVYVKGILVHEDPKLAFGYDLLKVSTDRDRRMISTFDLESATSSYWSWTREPGVMDLLWPMLRDGAPDVAQIQWSLNSDEAKVIADYFKMLHGEYAWPVHTQDDYDQVGHWGFIPVVVNEKLCDVLSKGGFSLEAARDKFNSKVVATYQVSQLGIIEREILLSALDMISPAAIEIGFPDPRDHLEIVDYSNTDTKGKHITHENGKTAIQIARSVLTSFTETLQVLVHEVAHHAGGDGSVHHERAEGRIFSHALAALYCRLPVDSLSR